MTVLVAGAAGQLGREMARVFAEEWQVVALPRDELDITDQEAVLRVIKKAAPAVIVNCAAYNDVDGAEVEPVTAMQVNGLAVRSLAEAAKQTGAMLVHYSTDFVFDGETDRLHCESTDPRPQSVYATSKLVGEWFARLAPNHYVLRVESLFGGEEEPAVGGRLQSGSTLDRMVDALLEGRPVYGFSDRTVSPSYVPDVSTATLELVRLQPEAGIYHCVNTGSATWFEIARVAAGRLESDSDLLPVTIDEVELRAVRPKFCALSNQKLAAAGIPMPTWEDALGRYLAERQAMALGKME